MQNATYFVVGIAALGGLWILWDFALKGLCLDALRNRVFELRFMLFELGMSGTVPFESDTYRTIETLLNGVLRFGHRFTLTTYILSAIEQAHARKAKDYEDISQQIALKVSRFDPEVQRSLNQILSELQRALLLYMAFTSLLFFASAVVIVVLKVLRVVKLVSKNQVAAVFEQEAYRAESRQHRLLAA